ncbi:hypothetical protein [Pseudonocardia xishanensis]|uniref:NIPSNAP protein n=1 Tax=Pseudonocardia xishanensis TaxID=630995 RepID=A0ABP8RZD2_9PSEU
MQKGICYVESYPTSPEQEAEYNEWYDKVHLREIVSCDGFVSARRYAPAGPGLPYVAIYEIESEDVQSSVDGMWAFARSGRMTASEAIQSDPPAVVRALVCTAEHVAVDAPR